MGPIHSSISGPWVVRPWAAGPHAAVTTGVTSPCCHACPGSAPCWRAGAASLPGPLWHLGSAGHIGGSLSRVGFGGALQLQASVDVFRCAFQGSGVPSHQMPRFVMNKDEQNPLHRKDLVWNFPH